MQRLFFRSHHLGRSTACAAAIFLTLFATGAAPASQRDLPRARPAPAPAVDPQLRELIPPAPVLHRAFAGDKRLSRPVTVAMANAPMRRLLAELSRSSGVTLTATPDVADDEVTAGFKGRSPGEILTLLSTHFGFTWRQDHGGYKLWQGFASKQREEALRQRDLKTLIDELVRAAPLALLPAEVIKTRTERLLKLNPRELDAAESAARTTELNGLFRVARPEFRLALQVLGQAPAGRIRNLLRRGSESFSTGAGEISLEQVERWWTEQRADGGAGSNAGNPPKNLTVEYRLDPRT